METRYNDDATEWTTLTVRLTVAEKDKLRLLAAVDRKSSTQFLRDLINQSDVIVPSADK